MLKLRWTSLSVSLSPLLLGNQQHFHLLLPLPYAKWFPPALWKVDFMLLQLNQARSSHHLLLFNPTKSCQEDFSFLTLALCFPFLSFCLALCSNSSSLPLVFHFPIQHHPLQGAQPFPELSWEGRTWHLKWHRVVTISRGSIIIITNVFWGNTSRHIPSCSPSPEGQVWIWGGLFYSFLSFKGVSQSFQTDLGRL